MEYPIIFQNLIDCFKKLPGVGAKTAERMAYDVLAMSKENIENFSQTWGSLLLNILLQVSGSVGRQHDNIKGMKFRQKEIKLSFVTGDMIMYM